MTRWPSPQDYREAIQTPNLCFEDEELRAGEIVVDALQLPKVHCGQFAAVFQLKVSQSQWAVRCFLSNLSDRSMRYQRISEFVHGSEMENMVEFRLIERGIKVNGEWFPILKMQFVQGITFGNYIHQNVANKTAMNKLLEEFENMVRELKRQGVAHGDLQHDNIIVLSNGKLKLVDYDGMYVPALANWSSAELGHRNYQHPARCEKDFGPYLDNFSALLIRASLKILIERPDLYAELNNTDDFLLFRQADFNAPRSSRAFGLVESQKGLISELSRSIRYNLSLPIEQIGFIDQAVLERVDLPSVEIPPVPKSLVESNPDSSTKWPGRLDSLLLINGKVEIINSKLTQEQVLIALSEATDKEQWELYFLSGGNGSKSHVLKIDGEHFRLRARNRKRDYSIRELNGYIVNHPDGGCSISYRLGVPGLVIVYLAYTFGFIFLQVLSLKSVVPFFMILIALAVNYNCCVRNEARMIELLRQIADGEKVPLLQRAWYEL